MARVRINRATARVVSTEAGVKLINQVLYELSFEAHARVLVGPYVSGNLARSLHREGPTVMGRRVTGRVGSDLPYAMSVERGAEVHAIFPKGARGVYRFGRTGRPKLRFYWREVGRVVYLPQVPGSRRKIGVSHPGQPGKHYLTESLRNVARRHGMRVIIIDV
jgi:hypothetical protein